MDKSDVLMIRAKEKVDYVFDSIKAEGFEIVIPYKDYNLFFRILRELSYRIPFLDKKIWFNNRFKKVEQSTIVIFDPTIKPELIKYLRTMYPKKRIVFVYENRVVNHFNPHWVDGLDIEFYSYDPDDCNEYHMKHLIGGYHTRLMFKPGEPKYDVLFLGRDKGRGDYLLDLEHKLNEMGITTKFWIVPNKRIFNEHKRYYKKRISYYEYLEMLKQSKAILNIMPEGQKALTLRDYEVAFNGIKGITNNKYIVNYDIYDPSRFFILGIDSINSLKEFIGTPFKEIPKDILQKYTSEHYFNELLKMNRD